MPARSASPVQPGSRLEQKGFASDTMRQGAQLGINYVWMHRAFGAGSVSQTATDYGRAHGITVIDGGCPLKFEPIWDRGKRVIRAAVALTGKAPKRE